MTVEISKCYIQCMINYCEVNKYIINSLEVPLQSKQPKVLIIGGGFGGIATAKALYGIAVGR